MSTKHVSHAPTTIDLAGGTVDLWPLYLFLENPVTLNLGIDLFAEAVLEIAPAREPGGGRIRLRAEDQKVEKEFSWDELGAGRMSPSQVPAGLSPAVELHFK